MIACSSPVLAQTCWLPPPQFDKTCPGMVVRPVDYWDIHVTCTGAFPEVGGGRRNGCFKPPKTIIVPKVGVDASTELVACVYRHERAHCNGWPADHPNAR